MAVKQSITSAEVAELNRRYTFFDWSRQSAVNPLSIERAEGIYLYDFDGKRYMDFNAQLMNVNIGYQHPKVIQAIKDQAERLCYVSPRMATLPRGELGRLLSEVTPGDLSKSFFTLGGTEATDHAIKIARAVTGRQKIVSRYRSYHGSTFGAMSLTGEPRRWANEPGIPGIVRVLDPFRYRCSFCRGEAACDLRCADHLEEVIGYEGPQNVAAVIMEPVTGANGIIIPPEGYFQRVREICDRHGILFIADEVMSGFCRTGKWFAIEHWDVVPDIMTVSKGLTSGYVPLGAVVVNDKIAKHFEDETLWMGLTYGAHTLACAAAIATIEVYREEGIPARVTKLGEVLAREYSRMMRKHPSIGETRNIGLFSAIELVKDRQTREPLVPALDPRFENYGPVKEMGAYMLKRGLTTLTRWNWVFVNPPLTITEEQLLEGLDIVDGALEIADRALD